jgi:succinate-acetate transporter protein
MEARDGLSLATTRVVLRPLASPLPLGFLGLAGASLVVAGLNLGWIDAGETPKVALVLIAFTVPLQFLASILGFLARDGVISTGMGLLSGIWFASALVLLASPPRATSEALGLFLLLGGTAMLVPASAAAPLKLVPAAVLGTAGVRFLVTGVYHLTESGAWEDAAGVVGLLLTPLAVYAAWAASLEDVHKRTILPLGRRGRARRAVERGLDEQMAPNLAREPGVRHQL